MKIKLKEKRQQKMHMIHGCMKKQNKENKREKWKKENLKMRHHHMLLERDRPAKKPLGGSFVYCFKKL